MTIYFIRVGRVVKIGYTEGDPQFRLAALQTGNHRKLRLLLSIPGEVADERRLHRKFERYRITGEWFTYSRPIRSLVRTLSGIELAEPDLDEPIWEPGDEVVAVSNDSDPSLLGRIRTVWPQDSDRAAAADLAVSLGARWREYEDWGSADLTRALRGHGVMTRPIRLGGRTVRGIYARTLDGAP